MDKMGRNIIPGWIGKQKPASLLRYILVDFGPTCALREFLKGSRRPSLPPLPFVLDRRLHIDFSPLLSLSLSSVGWQMEFLVLSLVKQLAVSLPLPTYLHNNNILLAPPTFLLPPSQNNVSFLYKKRGKLTISRFFFLSNKSGLFPRY